MLPRLAFVARDVGSGFVGYGAGGLDMSGEGRFGTSSRLVAVVLCCAVVWSGAPASAVAGESSPAEGGTFDWRVGGTMSRAFAGPAGGRTVVVFVAKEGPYQGRVLSAVAPNAARMGQWGLP
jgi:hypothetical protein